MNPIEGNSDFAIQEKIDSWINTLNSNAFMTEADTEELKTHLFDIVENLKKAGLDNDEAFIIASRRMGNSDDITEEYKQSNSITLQMKKSLTILTGVLLYFLSFYFIKATSKILIFLLIKINEQINDLIVILGIRYLIFWCFIVFITLISIYLMDRKTFVIIEKIKLKPNQTITILLLTIMLAVADFSISPFIKKAFGEDFTLIDKYAHMNIYFDVCFPLIMCICFIFIYYKYYSKTKIL